MNCKHCDKTIDKSSGWFTVKSDHYHNECYAEVFEGDGEPRENKRIKELELQVSIYHDHKDVSLTKDLERIAELEAFLDELRNDLSLDEAVKYLVRINKVLGENEQQNLDIKGNLEF